MTKNLSAFAPVAVLLSCLAFSASCGTSVDADADGSGLHAGFDHRSEKNRFQYQYILNGCDTGEQVFHSKADLCAGLANHSLNHGCAYELRKDHFDSIGCTGWF